MIALKWFEAWRIVRVPMKGQEKRKGCDVVYLAMGAAVWLPINALPDVREEGADATLNSEEARNG